MDIFVEQLVKKKHGTKDYLIIGAIVLGGLVLILASFLIPAISFLVIVGVIFGAYYLISARNVEFEYSVTNGDITIDKIINRRNRKRVVSLDAHDIEDMGKFRPEIVRNKNGYKPYYVSQTDSGENSWYFCAHTSKYGNVLVVFDPNERVMEAIKPFIPRQVAFVVFGRH
jgi:hypothetical protein